MKYVNEKRIDRLVKNFELGRKNFTKKDPGFPESAHYFHKKVLKMIRSHEYSCLMEDRKIFNSFLEFVYATLASWGLDRMTEKPRLVKFEKFKESVRKNSNLLIQLSKYKLQELDEREMEGIKEKLSFLFKGLKVMEGEKKLIGVSKAMHHLLPDLVPPIDGPHTLKFFETSGYTEKNQKDKFFEIFEAFYNVAKKLNLKKEDRKGVWDTSVPKIIDNAIIGLAEKLSLVVDKYMRKTTGLRKFCERCLETKRWGGNVVLMIVDAAFDSIGLNYFNSIVPKVMKFEEVFVKSCKIKSLQNLADLPYKQVKKIWTNQRSWKVANEVASFLSKIGRRENLDDRQAFRKWASSTTLKNWKQNPIAKIKGVGLTTYQYLRMMGGVDTSMPDKIVRRVVEDILSEAKAEMPTDDDIKLIKTIDRISKISGYRPIEICWMTWLVQSEGNKLRMEKYQDILHRI